MSNVIHLVPHDAEPRVSSAEIASQLGVAHKASIQLVRKYLADFQEAGRVTFEMAPFQTRGGDQRREVAFLNEEQCYLLLAYSRNTVTVRRLKRALVRAFTEARKNGFIEREAILQELAALDAQDATSSVKGRFGSRLMNERKADLRQIRPRRQQLERELQPQLALAS